MEPLIFRTRTLVPSLVIFIALLACKGETRRSESQEPLGSASAPASESPPPAVEEAIDKRTVCGLYGKNSDSERCSDCVDDAEQSNACSGKAEAWERCAGDIEKLAESCAGQCVNQCVKGQKSCCECTTDCIANKHGSCTSSFLRFERCAIDKCKNECS